MQELQAAVEQPDALNHASQPDELKPRQQMAGLRLEGLRCVPGARVVVTKNKNSIL